MNKLLQVAFAIALPLCSFAVEQTISLPAPDKAGGKPLMQSLTLRKTMRNYTGAALSKQDLSDLLYATWGVNRTEGSRVWFTVPTAVNAQDLVVYVALREGTYLYEPVQNTLQLLQEGDFRGQIGPRQPSQYATSGAVFIIASDFAKLRKRVRNAPEEKLLAFANFHAGSASQNLYLACASKGLGTVVCASIDTAAVVKHLNLPENIRVLYAQPVGTPVTQY